MDKEKTIYRLQDDLFEKLYKRNPRLIILSAYLTDRYPTKGGDYYCNKHEAMRYLKLDFNTSNRYRYLDKYLKELEDLGIIELLETTKTGEGVYYISKVPEISPDGENVHKYTRVPINLLEDMSISVDEVLVLMGYFHDFYRIDYESKMKQTDIEELLGLNKKTIIKATKSLEDKGLIKIEGNRKTKRVFLGENRKYYYETFKSKSKKEKLTPHQKRLKRAKRAKREREERKKKKYEDKFKNREWQVVTYEEVEHDEIEF